jgi:hypothetical protein
MARFTEAGEKAVDEVRRAFGWPVVQRRALSSRWIEGREP